MEQIIEVDEKYGIGGQAYVTPSSSNSHIDFIQLESEIKRLNDNERSGEARCLYYAIVPVMVAGVMAWISTMTWVALWSTGICQIKSF